MKTVSLRILVAASVAVASSVGLTPAGAYAQGVGGMGGGGRGHHARAATKTDQQKPKADDKAYRDALKGLPDKPYDPWSHVR